MAEAGCGGSCHWKDGGRRTALSLHQPRLDINTSSQNIKATSEPLVSGIRHIHRLRLCISEDLHIVDFANKHRNIPVGSS